MIGAETDGLLAAMQMGILAKLPYPMVRDAIFAHPTMAEGLGLLFPSLPQEHARQRFPVRLGEAHVIVSMEETHASLRHLS
jgi:hypothetical protein